MRIISPTLGYSNTKGFLLGPMATLGILLVLSTGQISCQTNHHEPKLAQAEDKTSAVPSPLERLAHWDSLAQPSGVPSSGEDFALIYDPPRHRMILFGGKNDDNKNINETWALDLATNQWINFTSKEVNPPPREDHIILYDPLGDRMILHGGENNEGTVNSTWSLDMKSMTWTDITHPKAPPSEDHTAIYDSKRKRMVIFGGQDTGFMITDIEALDLDPQSPTYQEWSTIPVKENRKKKNPGVRIDHVAIYDSIGDRMVIFGGYDKDKKYLMNDTWAFDFESMTWKEHARKKRHSKPSVRRHAAVAHDTKHDVMLIFGGTAGGLLNDVWAFDLELDEWFNISPGPPPRKDHAAVYDPRNYRMILYGGETISDGIKLHDLWELTIQKR